VPRHAADEEFVYLLGVAPVAELDPGHGSWSRPKGCRLLGPAPGLEGAGFAVPSRGFRFRSSGGAEVTVGLRRFSDLFVPLAPAAGGSWQRLVIPGDGLPGRWRAAVQSTAPVRVCPLGTGGGRA
jgi:hypothetical protein